MNKMLVSVRSEGLRPKWMSAQVTEETAKIDPKGNSLEWACGESRLRYHAEHFSILQKAAKILQVLCQVRGKVTLMMLS